MAITLFKRSFWTGDNFRVWETSFKKIYWRCRPKQNILGPRKQGNQGQWKKRLSLGNRPLDGIRPRTRQRGNNSRKLFSHVDERIGQLENQISTFCHAGLNVLGPFEVSFYWFQNKSFNGIIQYDQSIWNGNESMNWSKIVWL